MAARAILMNELYECMHPRTGHSWATTSCPQLPVWMHAAGSLEDRARRAENAQVEGMQLLESLTEELSQAQAASRAAANEAAEHRAIAAERTKKFAILQVEAARVISVRVLAVVTPSVYDYSGFLNVICKSSLR